MNVIQSELLILLRLIDEICRKNRIEYFITAGTLLGAVRDGGFIPWDDDCDVIMPRNDYRKFVRIMRSYRSNIFYFQDRKSEKKYPYAFSKIRSRRVGARERGKLWREIGGGCFVDIFPLDKCPENPKRAKRFFKLIELFTSVLLGKCEYKKRSARIIFSILSVLPRSFCALLRDAVRIYYSVTSGAKRLATVYGSYGYPRESYMAKWFNSPVYLSFEGEKFPAPIGYRELLTNIYDSYMTPPKKSEQRGHLE